VLDLFKLSHVFAQKELLKLCEELIGPLISIENCALILQAVEQIGDGAMELKESCVTYILANYSKVIITPQYFELPRSIMMEINQRVSQIGVKINLNQN